MAGNKPGYSVCVSRKENTNGSRRVGAGWIGDKGQVNIKFDFIGEVIAKMLETGYELVLFENKE